MKEIIRNRTIRPSTRDEKSSYKIDTNPVSKDDILIVHIDHESKDFTKTYKFNGIDIAQKNSISFRVKDYGTSIDISWSGATPIGIETSKTTSKPKQSTKIDKAPSKSIKTYDKTSFPPIANTDTTIIILGTMPGDKSLEIAEYYGHPRNKFWKIISAITGKELPNTYSKKIELLLSSKIGVWDVAHAAVRKGSLDSAIKDETPNDLNDFIEKHENLKVIGFNGKKSETLFDKYFKRKKEIKYITLPSSSPANTGLDFETICEKWSEILTK